MSAYNFPAADFTPQLVGYTGQGAFRFWCQKVLPLVYDDSLSYYELLNKVVHYLNNVISDVSNAETNIDNIVKSFEDLQNYINEYFGEALEEVVDKYFIEHPDLTVPDNSVNMDKLTEDVKNAIAKPYAVYHFIAPGVDIDPNTGEYNSNGAGTCVLVECHNKFYLVDTFTTYQFNTYAVPYLRKRGVHELECVFVSHYHGDHCGGVVPLCESTEFVVKKFVLPPMPDVGAPGFIKTGDSESVTNWHNMIVDALSASGIDWEYADENKPNYHFDGGLEVAVSNTDYSIYYGMVADKPAGWNSQHSDEGLYPDYNNYSVGFEFFYRGGTAMFPGDANFTGLNRMAGMISPCDLLSASHHNHQQFYTPLFFNKAKPKLVANQDSCIEYNKQVRAYKIASGGGNVRSYINFYNRQPARILRDSGVEYHTTNTVNIVAAVGNFGCCTLESNQKGDLFNDGTAHRGFMQMTYDGTEKGTGTGGYRVWVNYHMASDGTLVQFGELNLIEDSAAIYPNSDKSYEIPLLVPFFESSYAVYTNLRIGNITGEGYIDDYNGITVGMDTSSEHSPTIDKFYIRALGSSSMSMGRAPNINWMAVGKWLYTD